MTPDEQFWGPPRRRMPLSRSMLVNFMGIALALKAGGRRMALAKRVLADAERVVANSVYTARLAESAGVPRSRLLVAHPFLVGIQGQRTGRLVRR